MTLILLRRVRLSSSAKLVFSNKTLLMRQKSSSALLPSYIVTPKELREALDKDNPAETGVPRLVPLCASWFLPNDPKGRTGQQVFRDKRIPSARFFDLDAVKDHDSPYPHMLPTTEAFAQAMKDIGIRKDDEVVVYDTQELGIFSAPRVAWTLQVFGHPKVHVLNNFRLWVEQGYPTESGDLPTTTEDKSSYAIPNFNPDMVVKFAEVKQITREYGKEGSEKVQVLDARSKGRWAGTEPEPRPGLPSGHMPGSFSVPITDLLDPVNKTLLPRDDLRKIFESKGIDPTQPIISSCGTGVTAAVIDIALSEAGFGNAQDRRLYDGSWTYELPSRIGGYANE